MEAGHRSSRRDGQGYAPQDSTILLPAFELNSSTCEFHGAVMVSGQDSLRTRYVNLTDMVKKGIGVSEDQRDAP
jgi:hypothetical protein